MGSVFLLISTVGLFTGLRNWSQNDKFMAMVSERTYDWYKANNPKHTHGNAVSCNQCGGKRIHVRSLMNHTYTRSHFCAQCGTTLYYSPEN